MIIKGNDDLSHVYILKRFDKAILIDPSHSLNQIKEALNGYQLEGILLTHGHIDHTLLMDAFDCPIYIHKDDYAMLFDADQNGSRDLKIGHTFNKESLNIKFITDNEALSFVDEFIKFIHTPGHTKGGVCFLYRNQLYTGDTLFKGSVGRTDLVGGSTASLNKSIKKICQSLPQNTQIYPGHDQITTLKDEKKHNPYVAKVLSK